MAEYVCSVPCDRTKAHHAEERRRVYDGLCAGEFESHHRVRRTYAATRPFVNLSWHLLQCSSRTGVLTASAPEVCSTQMCPGFASFEVVLVTYPNAKNLRREVKYRQSDGGLREEAYQNCNPVERVRLRLRSLLRFQLRSVVD